MDNLHKSFLMFLGLCIPIRFLIMYFSKITSTEKLQSIGYIYFLISIGMMYIYLTDSRKTGLESFGKKIWWNDLRPIFSIIYFLFAANAIQGNQDAYKYLAFDLILGFVSFILHYFT